MCKTKFVFTITTRPSLPLARPFNPLYHQPSFPSTSSEAVTSRTVRGWVGGGECTRCGMRGERRRGEKRHTRRAIGRREPTRLGSIRVASPNPLSPSVANLSSLLVVACLPPSYLFPSRPHILPSTSFSACNPSVCSKPHDCSTRGVQLLPCPTRVHKEAKGSPSHYHHLSQTQWCLPVWSDEVVREE